MSFLILILLAIIQGITEFLPISSSGHLVLLYNLFGITDGARLLSIVLHIATLLSVVIYYRKDILLLVRMPFCSTNRKILTTTITTCLLVLIIKPIIDATFDGAYIFVFFITTAILLFTSDYMSEKHNFLSRTSHKITQNTITLNKNNITNINISYKQAIIIGITQAIACIPGISRSGSTIAVTKIMGVNDASRYSFLISIPIIIASFVMEIADGGSNGLNIPILSLIISMTVCFIVGLFAIKIVNSLSQKNKLTYFAYYLLAISTLLVIASFLA